MAYQWTLPITFEPIDWQKSADEWIHWLGVCLAEQDTGVRHTGTKIDETTKPFTELSAVRSDEMPSNTHLLLFATTDGVLVSLGAHEGELDDEVASAWAAAVTCATGRVGQASQTFEWTAIIGPGGGGRFALADLTQIGPFALSPAGRSLTVIEPNEILPSLHSRTSNHSWPILVRGSHEGYNWPDTSKRAARELRRLCALLSLDREFSTWTVLESPAPIEMGERTLPDSGYPFYSATHPQGGGIESPPAFPDQLWQPADWIPGAWDLMAERAWLAHAVVMNHEGQLVEGHPSLAHVAYVSSVEAISNRLFEEERCPECRTHLNVAARFRETLKLVLPPEQVPWLESSYGDRSKSVHQGRLHGSDSAPGQMGLGAIFVNPERDFDIQVIRLRLASKKLLILALRDQLPRRRRFEPPS